MAARGNRFVGVGRFGVACMATVVVALGSIQPAFAQEAPPTETTSSEQPPASTTPAAQPEPEPTPPADPKPDPEPPAEKPPPAADPPASDPPDAPATEPAPSDTSGAASEPPAAETPAKDVVKLEEAPAAAPAPVAPAPTPQPVQVPAPAAVVVTVVLIQEAPAASPATPETAAAEAEAEAETETDVVAAIVSLRRPPGPSAVALPSDDEATSTALISVRAVVADKLPAQPARRQSCARPRARVPLSERCEQIRDVASLRLTLTYANSVAEVRAAIARVVTHVTIRRVEAARPPPKSKAAKKRPVAEARPIAPFGASGQGMTNDGFSGSPGSASSSRLFAVPVAASVRVPRPARFARLRLPSTIPHGVNAAPPPARPG